MNKDIRTLSHVPRWTIIRTLRQQSVADHSYYVVMYAGMIGQMMKIDSIRFGYLLWYAALHDLDELVTGDIPSPVKHPNGSVAMPDLSPVSAHEIVGIDPPLIDEELIRIVKIADILDAVMFIGEEIRFGNQEVNELYTHLFDQLEERVEGYAPAVRNLVFDMAQKNTIESPRLIK